MAKPYEAPKNEQPKPVDEDAMREKQAKDDPVAAEKNRQAAEAEKEDKKYLDQLNHKLKELVDAAAASKEKHPHHLNYTVDALKNAASQIEAQTPQGSSYVK